MNRPDEEPIEASQLTTVLNRLRPTVVVRRRVYEVAREQVAVIANPATDAASTFEEEDDDSGPPSSVNVARALAHLRADELHRLEEILSAQDEEERKAERTPAHPPVPTVPTVRVGPVIALPELARRMAVPTQELVTALVTRGFFSVTFKSTLPRETARAAAWMFGWLVEDDDSDVMAAAPAVKAKAKAQAKASAKAKAAPTKAKAKTKVVTKTSAKKKR
jgi:hypothetical protein